METDVQVYQKMLENYAAILEKTNQQLSLWSNPYGLSIGILSVLIAVIAIGVAFVLWRNSKEQREQLEKFVFKQEKIFKEQNKIRNESVQRAEIRLDEMIKQYQKNLDSATKEGKKELKKSIQNLAKEKAVVGTYIGPTGPTGPSYNDFVGYTVNSIMQEKRERNMICSNCGKSFSFIDDSGRDILSHYASYVTGDRPMVYCTHCGAINVRN